LDGGSAIQALKRVEIFQFFARLTRLHRDSTNGARTNPRLPVHCQFLILATFRLSASIPEYHRTRIDLDQFICLPSWQRAAPPTRTAARATAQHDLGQCGGWFRAQTRAMWQHVSSAPFDRDLELAVIDDDGPHALVFPCRRILNGWMKVETKERLDVRPTHWREWQGVGSNCSDPLRTKQNSR
jgi:hypothetical protein